MIQQENIARIIEKWAKYPVRLNILEINSRRELPQWQDCKKNELWIGVKRGDKRDTLYVIKHQTETVFNLACRFERLTDADLALMGVYSQQKNYCKVCGEFSTRINKDGSCCDCHNKLRSIAGKAHL